MNRSTTPAALLALAALSTAALAQLDPTAEVRLNHSDADGVINVGDTVTWTLQIAFENAEVASGGNMEIMGNNNLGFSSAMTFGQTNGGNNGGDSNGAGIGIVSWTNSLFIEPFGEIADRRNPYLVGTFDFTATAIGILEYSVIKGPFESAFVHLDLTAFTQHFFENPDDVAISIDTLTIIPAPASALLFMPAAFFATRRRR